MRALSKDKLAFMLDESMPGEADVLAQTLTEYSDLRLKALMLKM